MVEITPLLVLVIVFPVLAPSSTAPRLATPLPLPLIDRLPLLLMVLALSTEYGVGSEPSTKLPLAVASRLMETLLLPVAATTAGTPSPVQVTAVLLVGDVDEQLPAAAAGGAPNASNGPAARTCSRAMVRRRRRSTGGTARNIQHSWTGGTGTAGMRHREATCRAGEDFPLKLCTRRGMTDVKPCHHHTGVTWLKLFSAVTECIHAWRGCTEPAAPIDSCTARRRSPRCVDAVRGGGQIFR